MRKVAAGLFSSIDGVVEAPNEWQPRFDEEMGAVLSRMCRLQHPRFCGSVVEHHTDEGFSGQPTSSGALIATYRPIR
jgi:hypothetical protein